MCEIVHKTADCAKRDSLGEHFLDAIFVDWFLFLILLEDFSLSYFRIVAWHCYELSWIVHTHIFPTWKSCWNSKIFVSSPFREVYNYWTVLLTSRFSFLDAEWTLYEQVAIAAMDCQCLDVAKVLLSSSSSLCPISLKLYLIFFVI